MPFSALYAFRVGLSLPVGLVSGASPDGTLLGAFIGMKEHAELISRRLRSSPSGSRLQADKLHALLHT